MLTIVALVTGQSAWAQSTWTQSFPTSSGGTGTENDPYLIKTTDDLNALASDVNSGNRYGSDESHPDGYFFQLDNDIEYDPNDLDANGENYTAIGRREEMNGDSYIDYAFGGHFDGQNHTVRGIRINKTGNNVYADRFQGLFGIVNNGGTVKNVCVSDAVITGYTDVGGIVGRNHGTIENCHVSSTVSVIGNNYQFGIIGGIAGLNNSGSFISWCTSAATVSGCYEIGGIVGLNYTTIMDCSANGANVTATDGKGGAIVGDNDCGDGTYDAILSRNYYTGCTLTTGSGNNVTTATTNIGCGNKATEDINSDTYTPTDVTEMTVNGVTYYDGAVSYWNWLKNLLANASTDASNPTVITLVCDVVAGSGDSRLVVETNRHAVIDLNGHKIDRGLTEAKSEGNVIYVRSNASLVIRDSQGGGQITGGYVTNGSGGGITSTGNSRVTLEGGTICGNKSNNHAGGVFVGGTFTMTGGTITDNTCTANGSAIYSNDHTINLQGGTITCNKGKNAIYLDSGYGGHLNVSGQYDVSGNTLSDGTTAALDIMLNSRVITISGALNPTHPATVGFATGGPTITSGWSTYMNDADLDDCFTTTATGKGLGIVNGEVTIGTLHTITLANANITASAASAAQGKSITLGYSGELPTGYEVIYSVNGTAISGNTFAMPDENVTVSATVTPITYTVRFHKNNDNATGEMADQEFTYDATQTLTANAFTLSRDPFVVWTTNADGTGDSYTDQQSVTNLTAEKGAVVNLYAKWKHDWNFPEFTWAADHSTATAHFTCLHCGTTMDVEAWVSIFPDENYQAIVNLEGELYSDFTGSYALHQGQQTVQLNQIYYVSSDAPGYMRIQCPEAYWAIFYSTHEDKSITIDNKYSTLSYRKTHDGWSDLEGNLDFNHGGDGTVYGVVFRKEDWSDGEATVTVKGLTAHRATIDPAVTGGTVTLTEKKGSNLDWSRTGMINEDNIVWLNFTPDGSGVVSMAWTVTADDGQDVPVGYHNGAPYFIMPAKDVTVNVSLTMLTIAYIDRNGVEQTCSDYTVLTSSNSGLELGDFNNSEAWYVVNNDVTIEGVLYFNDQVSHLILCDGATLTVNGGDQNGITSKTLAIYSQSGGTGTVRAIGGYGIYANGNVTINGGTVNATGRYGIYTHQNLYINGGTVSATGTNYGISVFGEIAINGGTVSATGSYNGISTDSSLNLEWTHASDRIYASSYNAQNVMAYNWFTDGTNIYKGPLNINHLNAIANKTLMGVDVLYNNNNNSTIADLNGKETNISLYNRTLYKDGDWNTLCLPFGVTDGDVSDGVTFTGTPLEGATVMKLDNSGGCNTGFDATTGVLTLDFVAANEIEPGVAYIVKWDKAEGYDQANPNKRDLKNPAFAGVTIVNEPPADYQTVSADGKVSFIGNYDSVSFDANDKTKLFLGSGSTLYYPSDAMTVNAFRAYFQLNGLTAGDPNDPSSPVKAFVLNFGDETETGIRSIDNGQLTMDNGAWYDLQGRQIVNSKSLNHKMSSGIYIHNGRKVVIK